MHCKFYTTVAQFSHLWPFQLLSPIYAQVGLLFKIKLGIVWVISKYNLLKWFIIIITLLNFFYIHCAQIAIHVSVETLKFCGKFWMAALLQQPLSCVILSFVYFPPPLSLVSPPTHLNFLSFVKLLFFIPIFFNKYCPLYFLLFSPLYPFHSTYSIVVLLSVISLATNSPPPQKKKNNNNNNK